MIDANIYSEVYEILSYMDKVTVMKIPLEILENIKAKRNTEYISNINPDDIFNKNNINKKTLEILACLDVNYWMDEEKKETLKKNQFLKQQEEELEKSKKYNPNDIFKNNIYDKTIASQDIQANSSLIQYKESIFMKIFNKIKSIVKK